MVLAKHTLHVASGEKYIANAVFTSNHRFFTPVQANRAYFISGPALAISLFAPIPVNIA
jgi:hypothetical protein